MLKPFTTERLAMKTLEAQIADGTARVEDDASILKQLASTFIAFDPRYEIMPGTRWKNAKMALAEDYRADPGHTITE